MCRVLPISLYNLYTTPRERQSERERAFPFSCIVFEASVLSTYNTFCILFPCGSSVCFPIISTLHRVTLLS